MADRFQNRPPITATTGVIRFLVLALLLLPFAFRGSRLLAQDMDEKITAAHNIRVGITRTIPMPPSGSDRRTFEYTTLFPKPPLVAKIKKLHTVPNDPRTIEVVELSSVSLKTALREGAEKNCDFVVLTRFRDLRVEELPPTPGATVPVPVRPVPNIYNSSQVNYVGLQLTIVRVEAGLKVTDQTITSPSTEQEPSAAAMLEEAAARTGELVRGRYKP
jgi:hypothetical protein